MAHPPLDQAQVLRRRLEETTRDLAAARAGFDQTADRDLLEYYLYEISALGAKHTYLLRQMKSLGLEDSPGPWPGWESSWSGRPWGWAFWPCGPTAAWPPG